MNGRWQFRAFLCLLAPLAITSIASAQAGATASVLGCGGERSSTQNMRCSATIGQACIGRASAFQSGLQEGFWHTSSQAATAEVPWKASTAAIMANVLPNPLTGEGRLHITLPRSGTLSIRVIDVFGTTAMPPIFGEQKAGDLDISLSSLSLASGEYFAIVTFDGVTVRTPFIISH